MNIFIAHLDLLILPLIALFFLWMCWRALRTGEITIRARGTSYLSGEQKEAYQRRMAPRREEHSVLFYFFLILYASIGIVTFVIFVKFL
jgi:hypothetical protein